MVLNPNQSVEAQRSRQGCGTCHLVAAAWAQTCSRHSLDGADFILSQEAAGIMALACL